MAGLFGELEIRVTATRTLVRIEALDHAIITIGRQPGQDILLNDPVISRYHAELRFDMNGLALVDVGSRSGTWVPGRQTALPKNVPHPLVDGGTFLIGPYTLIYHAADAPVADPDEQVPAEQVPAEQVRVQQVPAVPVPEEPPAPLPSLVPVQPPRPMFPAALSHRVIGLYLKYLPDIFQDADFLGRFLLIFETIWEPLEQRQDHIEDYFDPDTCPASFLDWMANWLGIQINPFWAEARKRALLSRAMELYRLRGTLYGLREMIEVCTGVVPTVTLSETQTHVFQVRVALPTDGSVTREQIEDLIRTHKPAHTGYILEVG